MVLFRKEGNRRIQDKSSEIVQRAEKFVLFYKGRISLYSREGCTLGKDPESRQICVKSVCSGGPVAGIGGQANIMVSSSFVINRPIFCIRDGFGKEGRYFLLVELTEI